MARMQHYGVSVPAPDMSHILQIADRIGRNRGYNDFMAKVLAAQRSQDRQGAKLQLANVGPNFSAADDFRKYRERYSSTDGSSVFGPGDRSTNDYKHNDADPNAGMSPADIKVQHDKEQADWRKILANDNVASPGESNKPPAKTVTDNKKSSGGGGSWGHTGIGWLDNIKSAGNAFFSKAADESLTGLEKTVDIISRPSYGVNNFFKSLDATDSKQTGHQTFAQYMDFNDIAEGDLGTAFKAFGRGFTGKDKTTFSQVIKQHASADGKKDWRDNSWVQGGAGFVGDVLLDPTTYIGVGLVTKPLKIGTKALRGSEDANKAIHGTAKEIAALGVKRPDSLPKDFIGPREKSINLTTNEIHAMLGGSFVRNGRYGSALTRKSQQAAKVQQFTDSLPRLKKLIRDDPGLDTPSTLKQVDAAIAKYTADYKANLDDFSVQVYNDAAKKFDDNPTLWTNSEKGKATLAEEAANAIPVSKTANAFQQEVYAVKKGKSVFHDLLGEGWKNDKRISPEFRASVIGTTEGLARADKTHQAYKKQSFQIWKQQIEPLQKSLANADKGSADYKQLSSKLADAKAAQKHVNLNVNMTKAAIFHKLVHHHLNTAEGLDQKTGAELTDLLARESELNTFIKNNAGPEYKVAGVTANTGEGFSQQIRDAVPSDFNAEGKLKPKNKLENKSIRETTMNQDTNSTVSQSNVDKWGNPIEDNGIHGAAQELKTVQNRILEIQNNGDFFPKTLVDLPKELPEDFHVTEDFLKHSYDNENIKAYQTVVGREVDARAERLYQSKFDSASRSARSDVMKSLISPRVASMFGTRMPVKKGVRDVERLRQEFSDPFITVGKTKIFKTDKSRLSHLVKKDDLPVGKSAGDVNFEGMVNKESGLVDYQQLDAYLKSSNVTINPAHVAFDRMFKEEHNISLAAATKLKNGTLKSAEAKSTTTKIINKGDVRKAARKDAIEGVNADISSGRLKALQDSSLSVGHVFEAAKAQVRQEYAASVAAAHGIPDSAKAVQEQLSVLRATRDHKLSLHKAAYEESLKTRKAMADTLDEQITLNMLQESIARGKNHIRISVAGAKLIDVPVPSALLATTQAMSGLPIIKSANEVWSKSFSPASKMEPELNLARLRAQARTPDIIKHHVDEIRHLFSKYKPDERVSALRSVVKGVPVGNQELSKKMSDYFDELLPYFQGKVKVGAENDPITISSINRYLPDEFKLASEDKSAVDSLNIKTSADLVKAMRTMKPNTDPMKLMWHTRIAIEQSLSHKAMETTITSMYGVKRIIRKGLEKKDPATEQEKLIESLHGNHNWVTINELGNNHYFAPETAAEVKKLLHMMKPQNVHEITKVYDKAMRAWKSAVTVYNPGYYTRNGIGETMMGLFDGLQNPKWYTKAAHIMNYSQPDEVNQVLKTLEPWKKHLSTRQQGMKPIMTLSGGKTLSAEDVWVLYHETGLKSGFVSSEYDHYFPAAGKMKSNPAGQLASKINDGVRNKGEKFEDYFRVAHFMYRMGKSGFRDPAMAAQEAAKFVRKYHFDYTDFTPFEKTTMLRVFPFYKWTRKALPLMGGMLFTRPGKVLLYPKAMQNLSYGTGGTDPSKDNNGYFPNYEQLTPEWMKNLMAYPMGTPDQQGAQSYMHAATPQFDVFSLMQSPVSATIGMLNPLIKMPTEQALGQTLDPQFKTDFNKSKDEGAARRDHLLRGTPQTSFAMNALKGRGPGDSVFTEPTNQNPNVNGYRMDEKLLSFLSGLGFYENNKTRQKSEQMRLNFQKGQ